MLPDEIMQRLSYVKRTSLAELPVLKQAAVEQAPALQPILTVLLDKVARGVMLPPQKALLLDFGLRVMAAAGMKTILPSFLPVLRRSEDELEWLFGEESVSSITGLLLSLYDGNPDALLALVTDPTVSGAARWSLFQVLARLVAQGDCDRDRLIECLYRFEREQEGLVADHDMAWEGWRDATALLGLTEFGPRVDASINSGRIVAINLQAEIDDWHERAASAAADPSDFNRFDDIKIASISDPLSVLDWLCDDLHEEGDRDIPATLLGLSEDDLLETPLSDMEMRWLEMFLVSDQAPESCMDMEELQGFFTALRLNPLAPSFIDARQIIWGTELGAAGPDYDDIEQAAFVLQCLWRLWNSIRAELLQGEWWPYLFDVADEVTALNWAEGFMLGVHITREDWTRLAQDRQLGAKIGLIASLTATEDSPMKAPDAGQRKEIIGQLPAMMQDLLEGFTGRGRTQPVRVTKVGRNDPCPCGSGKKFKKCCGA